MKNLKSKSKGKYIVKASVFGVVAGGVFTLVVMLLWNWLMPLLFGLTLITFWQALGLLVLSKVLFGSRHQPYRNWQDREKSNMHKEMFSERMKKAHAMFHSTDDRNENAE